MRLAFGPFQIDSDRKELLFHEQPFDLHLQASFDALLVLVQRKWSVDRVGVGDSLVSKNDLMDAVWGDTSVLPVNLNVAISRLRDELDPKLLEQLGQEKSCIRTVHGRGFRFVLPVTAVPDEVDEHDKVIDVGSDWEQYRRQAYAWVCGFSLAQVTEFATSDRGEDWLQRHFLVPGTGKKSFPPYDVILTERFKLALQVLQRLDEAISTSIDACLYASPGEQRCVVARALVQRLVARFFADKVLVPFFAFAWNFTTLLGTASSTGTDLGDKMRSVCQQDFDRIKTSGNPYVTQDAIEALEAVLVGGVPRDESDAAVFAALSGVQNELDEGDKRLQAPPAVKIKTRIDRVTPIHANITQTIVIYGQGFGGPPEKFPVADDGVDTVGDSYKTSMAILNLGEGPHRWSAGRKTETNECAIGVRLRSWTDARIVLAGFTGPIGTSHRDKYQISEGDNLKIVIFGPANRCGPGGLPECPDEVRQGRVAVFDTVVRPPIAEDDSWKQ